MESCFKHCTPVVIGLLHDLSYLINQSEELKYILFEVKSEIKALRFEVTILSWTENFHSFSLLNHNFVALMLRNKKLSFFWKKAPFQKGFKIVIFFVETHDQKKKSDAKWHQLNLPMRRIPALHLSHTSSYQGNYGQIIISYDTFNDLKGVCINCN